MLQIMIMVGFSLYLASYGFVALFKQEWLTKLRAFSARVEGKSDIENSDLMNNIGIARRVMAVLALVLGIAGLVMSIIMLVLYIQAQGGPVAV